MAPTNSSRSKKVQPKLYPLFFQPASALLDTTDKDEDDDDDDDLEISLSDLGKKMAALSSSSSSKCSRNIKKMMMKKKKATWAANDEIKQSRKRMKTASTNTKLPRGAFLSSSNSNNENIKTNRNIVNKNKENNNKNASSTKTTSRIRNKKRRIDDPNQPKISLTDLQTTTDIEEHEKLSNASDDTNDDNQQSEESNIDNILNNPGTEHNPNPTKHSKDDRRDKNSRRKRIWSSSSMDYSPIKSDRKSQQQQACHSFAGISSSKNILHKLYHRPIYGSCGYRHGHVGHLLTVPSSSIPTTSASTTTTTSSNNVPNNKCQWRSPSWLKVEPPPSVSFSNNNSNKVSSVDQLAWDKMGILLATSSTKVISIYDWDMIKFKHQYSLNEKQRYKVEKMKLKQQQQLLRQKQQVQQEQQQEELQSNNFKTEEDPTAIPKTELLTPTIETETATASSTTSSASSSSSSLLRDTSTSTTPTTRRSQWSIPPVLSFPVPHTVTSLTWNPHNMDQLAVGFQ